MSLIGLMTAALFAFARASAQKRKTWNLAWLESRSSISKTSLWKSRPGVGIRLMHGSEVALAKPKV